MKVKNDKTHVDSKKSSEGTDRAEGKAERKAERAEHKAEKQAGREANSDDAAKAKAFSNLSQVKGFKTPIVARTAKTEVADVDADTHAEFNKDPLSAMANAF